MAIIRKTVTFTEQQDQWIKAQITAGEFTNDSEYLRHLVRKDQSENPVFKATQGEILKGIASPVSKKNVLEIIQEVELRNENNA